MMDEQDNTPTPQGEPEREERRPLPAGIACCACGYELQGLNPDSCCPECATPIEASLRSDALIFSSPRYLSKLRVGAEMAVWGGLAWFVFSLFAYLIQAVLSAVMPLLLAGILVYFLHISATLVMVWGIWKLTLPDDRPKAAGILKQTRLWARWLLVGSYGLQECALAVALLDPQFNDFLDSALVVTIPASVLGWAFLLRLVANYYKRGRVAGLAQWSRVASAMTFASVGIGVIFICITFFVTAARGPAVIGAAIFGFGMLPILIMITTAAALCCSFIALVELGSWLARARIRAEMICQTGSANQSDAR